MGKTRRFGAVAWLAAMVLAGCGKSPEDRINAAMPVAKGVADSQAAVVSLLATAGNDGQAFAQEYRDQLRIRAIECSHGLEPSWLSSDEDIRGQLANPDCFAQADLKLKQWLDRRRIALLLALPPLRAPTRMAGMLVADDRIQQAAFAGKAGVAALQWSGHYRLFDLATGESLHDGDLSLQGRLALSDNGRILVNGSSSGTEVRASDSGEVLATLPDPRTGQLHWLDDHGAVFVGSVDGGLVYFDLASGERQRLPVSTPLLQAVWRMAQTPATYALVGFDRVASLTLVPEAGNLRARVVAEKKFPPVFPVERAELVAAPDGRRIAAAGKDVLLFRPGKLAPDAVSFAPLRVVRALPGAGDGQWLLQIQGTGTGLAAATVAWYRYGWDDRSLAKLDTSDWLSTRVVPVPAPSGLALIDGSKLMPAPSLTADPARPLADLIADAEFEAQLAKLEAADRAPRPTSTRAAMPNLGGGFAGAAPRAVPAGREGLVEALRAGIIRTGDVNDLNEWIRRYESRSGHALGREYEERLGHQNIYVITGDFTVPSGLTGANSAIFVLERRAPFPHGDLGHAVLLDTNNGTCSGTACMIYVGR